MGKGTRPGDEPAHDTATHNGISVAALLVIQAVPQSLCCQPRQEPYDCWLERGWTSVPDSPAYLISTNQHPF